MFGFRGSKPSQANGGSKADPLLCHFDVNKTIIQSDSIQMKSIDQGIREGISELFWGNIRKDGDKVEWEWTKGKPSCAPPSDDVCLAGAKLTNYAQYCKEVIKDKAAMKEAIRSFSLVADQPVVEEMERLRQLTMKKMQLEPEIRNSKEAEAAGIKGPTFNMFPTLFHLAATLQRTNRAFAIIFRSFGADHLKVQTEWNAFCEGRHPIFSRLIEDIGPMNGSKPGIPDRRINAIHTLYRDSAGPVLILDTFTNGPEDDSWDKWARTKPMPKSDTRNGREYIKKVLKARTVEGYAGIQRWMRAHLLSQGTTAIKDDWAWWQFNGEQAHAGKLLTLISSRKPIQQLFFDDNIELDDARIVDCRDANGVNLASSKSLRKLCIKVNPVEAMLDNDYFLRKLLTAQGGNLDAGSSLIGLQKQLTEVEEERGALQKQLATVNLQLKTLTEENRRMKLQRRINVRDEGELQSLLAKEPDFQNFDTGGFRSLSDLFNEIDQGFCWLEQNDHGRVVRVLDMIFLKVRFKDLLLIESHEQVSGRPAQTRNYFPGVHALLKDTSVQQTLDRWLETGLQVNIKKCVETEVVPVSSADAPSQQLLCTSAYPIPSVVQQSIGTLVIPEKELEVHKDILSKIGLPGPRNFTTTEKDIHGATITRIWRWDKLATWEASVSRAANSGGSGGPINVALVCEQLYKNNARKDVYSRITLQMFENFEAQKLCGGFSGSVVIRVQPFDPAGRPGEPCIVKLDAGPLIREEHANSLQVYNALPDRAARILGEPIYEFDSAGEEFAAMRLELAGACWNVPELAQGSTNFLSTFKELLLWESEQVLLESSNTANDMRPFGNVNSVLAETFGPGGVVSSLRKGGKGKESMRRAEGKPLLWGWYTLKGKESKYNPITCKKGDYPAEPAIRRLYKEHFKEDLPALKDIVVNTIKPELEKLCAKAGKELCPLIALAHGDLNAANIMIDALDAVWLIDFATSVDLPLFTDMCKFEMACLFEYATIPITPKVLVEFASTSPAVWKTMNVGDWLRVDDQVAMGLLEKFCALPPERLANISQNDLDKLIDEVVRKSGKEPHKQRHMVRALKGRLVVDESRMEAALSYCCSISNTLLKGDYIGDTLEIKGIPLPEGRGSRGALSLRFFMDICVSVRRFMSQDIMSVLREQNKTPGILQPCDVLSLQLWLPFLRESYRIIGYSDVAPQQKLWSIYHCSKVSKNVLRILDTIKKNFTKLSGISMLGNFKEDLAKKTSLQREKTGDIQGLPEGGDLESESYWLFRNAQHFPHDEQNTRIMRKMHQLCPTYATESGFYSAIWQVTVDGDTTATLSFDPNSTFALAPGASTTKNNSMQALELFVDMPNRHGEVPASTRIKIGMVSVNPNGRKERPAVVLKSRLFRLSEPLLQSKSPVEDGENMLSDSFSLGTWSGNTFADVEEPLEAGRRSRESRSTAVQPMTQPSKFLTLNAKACDSTGREKMTCVLSLGIPLYCYVPGSNLCVDRSNEGGDMLESPMLVVMSLAESGLYVTRSAESLTDQSETEFDPMPLNHTYLAPVNYRVGQQLVIKHNADDQGYTDAEVVGAAAEKNGYQYCLKLKGHDETIMRHLHTMNSGRVTHAINASIIEEEMQKIKLFFRARYSSVIDSLSGARLNVKQCAPPTLSVGGGGVERKTSVRTNVTKGWSLASSSSSISSDSSNNSDSRHGWGTLLSTVEFCELMVPTCQPKAFLVLGSPGSGKSCLVCKLIIETLDRYANLIPMVLPVQDMVKRSSMDTDRISMTTEVIQDWFDKYLRVTWGEDSMRYCMVVQAMRMNRVLFLFEGLEDAGRLTPVIEACIRRLILDRHLVVITSRPLLGGESSLLQHMSTHLVVMKLRNLLDEHKRQIAHARLGLEGIDAFDRLFKRLRESQNVGTDDTADGDEENQEDVFGNPMMLSMLLCYLQTMQKKAIGQGSAEEETAEESGDATITAVYRVALDVMLKRVQTSTQAERHKTQERLEKLRRILEKMAMAMQLRRSLSIGVKEVEAMLPGELIESWNNLKAAVVAGSAMFLRMTEEAEKAELHFLVKGFQNYYAAQAVVREGGASLPDLVQLLTEPWWAEMLEMLVESMPKCYVEVVEKRLDRFEPKEGESFLHIAARAGHRPVFQYLKLFAEKNREALHMRNKDMRTPLHIAAEKGNTPLCASMLESNAPIEAEDSNDRLAMHVAMQHGAFQTARFLLKNSGEQLSRRGSVSRPWRGNGQVEQLANRILNNMTEEDFRQAAFQTFAELRFFGSKENDFLKATIGGLLTVFWIAANHYDMFVRGQPVEVRLTRANWENLQTWTKRQVGLVRNTSTLAAMLVYLAICNLGKIKPLQKTFAPEFDEPSDVMASVLQKSPTLVPSFAKLDDSLQHAILSALKADFNPGQFLQAENLPANLYTVQKILAEGEGTSSINILNFFLFKIFAQLSALRAKSSLEGSLFMVDQQYSTFKMGIDMLQHLMDESAQDVYNRFLAERAKKQHLSFNSYNSESRAIVRLACLCRFNDPTGGKVAADTFHSLDSHRRRALIEFLNTDGIYQKPGFLLYQSPNLLQWAHENPKLGLALGMKVMLRVYEAAAKEYAGSEKQVVTIMLEDLPQRAKTCTDPESFEFTRFEIARAAGQKADTQASVKISPWQLVNDPQLLEGYAFEADSLTHDILFANLREMAFLKRLPAALPELTFFENSQDTEVFLRETRCALLVVFWTAHNQFEAFARGQSSEGKLTEKSWGRMLQIMEGVFIQEVLNVVLVVMTVQLLGKIPQFRAQLAPEAEGHTQVLAHVLDSCPKVLPSYWCIGEHHRSLARACLTCNFNVSQFLQGETVAAALTPVKEMLRSHSEGQFLTVYIYCLFVQLSASLGPQTLDGSIYMTEDRWQEFEAGLHGLKHLESESEQAVYDRLLAARTGASFVDFYPTKAESHALGRLVCICNAEDGQLVVQAFEGLNPEERAALATYLNADGIHQKPAFVLVDCRKFMTNAMVNTEVGLRPALLILLRACQAAAREFGSRDGPLVTVQLQRLAEFAKEFVGSVTFQDLPFELERRKGAEAMVIPKVWIPIKKDNKAVLDSLSSQARELANDLLRGQTSERQFKNRLGRTFPELSYFNANASQQRQQTCGAMLSVLWLIAGQHEAFIRSQPDDEQLSKQSWAWIQEWMSESVRLNTDETVDAMLTFMAIHALGKIKEFREELAPGYDASMHDLALAHILNTQPEVVPSFLRLTPQYQRLIVDSLSVDFEFSQFLQAENVPANLMVVKEKLRPHGDEGFAFFCFRIFAQMCGKLGPRSLHGSLFMTEHQFQRFRPGLDALQQLRTLEAGPAYNAFLLLLGSKALSRFASPEHQALARLLCLGAASDYQRGDLVCKAFDELPPKDREKLTRWLTADGIKQRPGYVLCDAPGLLQHAEANPAVGLVEALRMLVSVQRLCSVGWGVHKVYVHLGELADWAKDAGDENGEFNAATLSVHSEDLEDSRICRVQVKRPQVGQASSSGWSRLLFCKILGSLVCLMLLLASAAGAVGLAVLPEQTEPYLHTVTLPLVGDRAVSPALATKVLSAVSVAMLVLLLLCCRACGCCSCQCCNRASSAGRGPGKPTFMSRSPGARPLLCNYTLLGSDAIV